MRKIKNLSDKISDALQPQKLIDPEDDEHIVDGTIARVNDYELLADDDELKDFNHNKLSDFRKKNIKLLNDVNKKYRGKIISRKDFENENIDSDDDEYEASSSEEVDEMDQHELDSAHDNDNDSDSSHSSNDNNILNINKQKKTIQFKHSNSNMDTDDSSDADEQDEDEEESIESNEEVNEDEDEDDGDENEYEGEEDDEDDTVDDDEEKEDDIDMYDGEINGLRKDDKNPITDQQKGVAIQNQLKISEKLLEIRIHSQKILLKSNGFPSQEKYKKLIAMNTEFSQITETARNNVEKLLNNLCVMQKHLMGQYSETSNLKYDVVRMTSSNGKRKSTGADEEINCSLTKLSKYSTALNNNHEIYQKYRNNIIQKWYDRTKILTPSTSSKQNKNNLDNFDIMQKIGGILNNKIDLIKKSQIYKGQYELFDKNQQQQKISDDNLIINESDDIDDHQQKKPNDKIDDVDDNKTQQIYSTEIYDDTDFYHSQLRELIEFKSDRIDNPSEVTRQFIELQKLRNKMKKKVDTRASKGRKIRYAIHHKMVNFMAPHDASDWTSSTKTELYSSLFN